MIQKSFIKKIDSDKKYGIIRNDGVLWTDDKGELPPMNLYRAKQAAKHFSNLEQIEKTSYVWYVVEESRYLEIVEE